MAQATEHGRPYLGLWWKDYQKFGAVQVGQADYDAPTDGKGSGVVPAGARAVLWLIKAPSWTTTYTVTFYRRVKGQDFDFWTSDETITVSTTGESMVYVQAAFGDEVTMSLGLEEADVPSEPNPGWDEGFSVYYKFTNDSVA